MPAAAINGTTPLRPDGHFLRLQLAGYEMPSDRSIDIDDLLDLEAAERELLRAHP
jgi:CMP-N-acetylneuraminic acid synthetase